MIFDNNPLVGPLGVEAMKDRLIPGGKRLRSVNRKK